MNKISFSRLVSHETCPRQEFINYILSKKEEVPKHNIFSTFGNSVHDGLESELDFSSFNFKDNFLQRISNFSKIDKDRFQEPWCKVGDWVVFARYAGSRIEIDGGEVRLLNDDEVLATVQDPTDILHKF